MDAPQLSRARRRPWFRPLEGEERNGACRRCTPLVPGREPHRRRVTRGTLHPTPQGAARAGRTTPAPRRPYGANAAAVLRKLAPIIRGRAAYYRTVVASKVFAGLDDYVWKLLHKWAENAHRTPRPTSTGRRSPGWPAASRGRRTEVLQQPQSIVPSAAVGASDCRDEPGGWAPYRLAGAHPGLDGGQPRSRST
ncbi:group II intron maturase-specific domain-containing protein [Kitasatospora kifunensis]|uniref:group II intron maturase-specific domain-containing protein n=1 Tax=Kitasatospora kifunensis TaxID=58351 RepID=UPI001622BBAD|nr:group II intron maturase-specific domain-containing protein [Kitasatospora kifunensis]